MPKTLARPLLKPREPVAETRIPSFDELYEAHFGFVWRTLRGLGVRPALLDDAAQDVYTVVHRRLGDFKPHASPRAWLFGIASRVARDYRRSARRKGPVLPVDNNMRAPDATDPFRRVATAQALQVVEEYIESLSEAKRSVFVLSEVEQLTAPEIADLLDTNLSTIYSRIQSVRKGFTQWIERLEAKTPGREHD